MKKINIFMILMVKCPHCGFEFCEHCGYPIKPTKYPYSPFKLYPKPNKFPNPYPPHPKKPIIISWHSATKLMC